MNRLFLAMIFVCALLSNSATSQSPSWVWAKPIFVDSTEKAPKIIVSNLGYSYVAGYFYKKVVLGSNVLVNPDSSFADSYIAKYNPTGTCMWATHIRGRKSDAASGINLDPFGNVLVVGTFEDTLIHGLDTLISSGSSDVFFGKLDPTTGVVLSITGVGDVNYEGGQSIGSDSIGNIYITGPFNQQTSFGTFNLNSIGSWGTFIVKFNPNGAPVWANSCSGLNGATVYSSRIDQNGVSYLTGSFTGSMTFGSTILTAQNSWEDIFTAVCDSQGVFSWAKRMGGEMWDYARGIGYDNFKNVYITGHFQDTVIFNGDTVTTFGLPDIYLAKYSSSGSEVWMRHIGGPAEDFGRDVVTDKAGDSYLCGHYRDYIKFTNEMPWADTALDFIDFFVCKFDSSGSFKWYKTASGYGIELPRSIGVDVAGNSYLTGDFDSTCFFNPVDSLFNTNVGSGIFLAKINNMVIQSLDEVGFTTEAQLVVYPSPATDYLTLSVENFIQEDATISIFDMFSKRVIHQLYRNPTINVSSLSPGIYILEIQNVRERRTSRFVKD